MSSTSQLPLITTPPPFCEYAAGPCDQSFENAPRSQAVFLYPNEPQIIANTIEEAVRQLRLAKSEGTWLSWKDFGVTGQIIFCQICKAIRHTNCVVADLTTLNFNLMFEVGFAIGLGVPVLPIRDASILKDTKVFQELGLVDTLGYFDFQNSIHLVKEILYGQKRIPVVPQFSPLDKEKPLYVMKSPLPTEGMIKLMSAVKKSGLRFRSFDSKESPRLPLHDAIKQVSASLGIVIHLLSPERKGAVAHNARCAFVAGVGLAMGRHVLMLQETKTAHPIDYRDVVRCYENPKEIQDAIIPFIKSVVEMMQESRFVPTSIALTPLEKVDLGDLAAENEIMALQSYFVPTGQYNEVKRGHARLVVGRKGAGKTAIFYGVRDAHFRDGSKLVLDLKPEGHQLVKLREAILHRLSPGTQQHVMTAFWNYLLLMEIAHRIIRVDERAAYRSPKIYEFYCDLRKAYEVHEGGTEQGDFSERLLALVDDIIAKGQNMSDSDASGKVTELIYRADIRRLNDAIGQYLSASRRDEVWLLFDNLDKGWPVFEVKSEDIRIITSLLEATRKLQRQFENRSLSLKAVVFLRNDIYQHLILDPGDRGKENPAILDWNDPEALKEMLRRRIAQSTELEDSFSELWRFFFDTHVKGEESFSYVIGRTLMRPRELLRFLRDCINVAVNRRHERVTEEDIIHAEKSYSDDALVDLSMELKDVNQEYANAPYAFIGSKPHLSPSDISILLMKSGVPVDKVTKLRELLLWFGFLGLAVYPDEERYAFQFEHNIVKMAAGVDHFSYCIHPAFREALGCVAN